MCIRDRLKGNEFSARRALKLRHGELDTACSVIISLDLIELCDVATLGGLILVLLNDGSIVCTNRLVSLLVESDKLEALSGLKLGNEVIHFLASTSLEEHVVFVDLANEWHEALRVMSAEVDGHEDLLLKVVLELA